MVLTTLVGRDLLEGPRNQEERLANAVPKIGHKSVPKKTIYDS